MELKPISDRNKLNPTPEPSDKTRPSDTPYTTDNKIYTQDIFGHVFPTPCWTGTYTTPCAKTAFENCSTTNATCYEKKRNIN